MLNISNLDVSHNIPNGNTSRMKNEQLDNADSCYSFDSDNQQEQQQHKEAVTPGHNKSVSAYNVSAHNQSMQEG